MASRSLNDPDAEIMSHVLKLWAKHWAHSKATRETHRGFHELCRDQDFERGFGVRNPLSCVHMSALLDSAFVRVMTEGDDPWCPWTLFEVIFGTLAARNATSTWAPSTIIF